MNFYKGNYDEAEDYFNISISLAPFKIYDHGKYRINQEDRENMSKIYLKQSINYIYLKKYDKGKDAINMSYSFFENNKNRFYKNMFSMFEVKK